MMKKRIISALAAASIMLGMLPGASAQGDTLAAQSARGAARASGSTKSNLDSRAYSALGFNTDVEEDNTSFFGVQNTVLMPKKELFFNYNGSSNYGKMLREDMLLGSTNTDLQAAGAYELYGQYKNGDWANLKDQYGYNKGQTGKGSTVIYSDIKSENKHLLSAWAESVAFNTGSGRDSGVATLYLKTKDEHRRNQRLCLEITNFSNEGKKLSSKTISIVNPVGPESAFNEEGKTYAHDHSAILDITAGDYDGDGKDEIAIYCGNNKVFIYEVSGTNAWRTQTIELDDPMLVGVDVDKVGDEKYVTSRAMVVTLQSFDLNQNNTDELVITASTPNTYNSTEVLTEEDYKKASQAYIYGCSRKNGSLERQAKIALSDSNYVLKAANSAAGDFTGNGRRMLILGGMATEISKLNDKSTRDEVPEKIGVITVSYNHSAKKYETRGIMPINNSGDYDSRFFSVFDGNKYNPPIGMAAFNMYGTSTDGYEPTRLYMFDRIFKYNKEQECFEDDGTKLYFGDSQRNNANEKCSRNDTWISEIVVGNFTADDVGRKEQLIAVLGQRQSGCDRYWYQIPYINYTEYGDVVCNWEGVINQGSGYYNEADREGPFLTLAAPDVDNDSLLLEYRGSETYFTKPEVQAVMQSPPYFEDVADIYDDYLNNGATAYGKASGSTEGWSASVEASLGGYLSAESSLGVSSEFEMSIKATASYEHQSAWTKTTEVEYAGGVGDDYVVMYTIPYHRYVYNSTDSNGKKGTFFIDEPMTPVTVLVTVDKYDEIASQYNGLEPIRGNILTSTPGDPSSYTSWAGGSFESVGTQQMLTNAGKGNGSTVTVSWSDESETENNFSVGIEESLKLGVGFGLFGNDVTAGIEQSFAVAGGGVYSKMNGVTYTGTVDNLPEGVTDFSFNWQFGHSTTELNGEKVVVIGYKTTNVKNPPTVPKNVAITDITQNSMTLEWDETPEAAIYELSFITSDGEELPLANIPGTAAADGTVNYEVKNLDPATGYTFAVKASDAYGMRSMSSMQVTGTTLSEGNDQFSITKQPQDAEAAVGHTAVFDISASSSSAGTIQYQWYQYNEEDKTWEKITGQNSSELKITATDELDGSRYYCIVWQGTRVLKSKSVTLEIGLSESVTELTVKRAGSQLQNNASVKSQYSGYTTETRERDAWKTKTVTAGGKSYTMLAASETENAAESGEITYEYGAPYLWMCVDGGKAAYYGDNNGAPDTSVTYPIGTTYTFSEDTKDDSKTPQTVVTGSDVKTITEVTIGKAKTTSAYLIAGTADQYIYICETAGEAGGKAYYKRNGENYDEYIFQTQTDTITIGENSYNTNDLVEKKEKTKEEYEEQVAVNEAGDTIQLTAYAKNRSGATILDGSVTFRILDRATGVANIVKGTFKNGAWTADYTFSGAGVYDITAAYGGTSTYKSSVSGSLSLNAYLPKVTALRINGGDMIYGDSFALEPVLIKENSNTKAQNVTYSVEKYDNVKGEWKAQSGLAAEDYFTPKAIGKYKITATCEENGASLSASTVVNVSAKTVIVTPPNVQGQLTMTRAEKEAKVKDGIEIDGALSSDESKINVQATSSAFTKKTKGDYQINVNVTNKNDFSEKYVFVTKTGTFSLVEGTVQVKVNAGANGSAYISYVTQKYDESGEAAGMSPSLTVDSGTLIPVGATVTFTANPNLGFGVNEWTGLPNGVTNPGKSTSVVVENIQSDASVGVTFSYALNSVTFNAYSEEGASGTVRGAYASGASFNSGDTLPIGTSITLTAAPSENSVLKGWQERAGADWEYIKGSDGTSNDTSLTYTISNVTSAKEIRAVFAKKEELAVTFSVVDENNQPITSADIYVNGEKITNNEYKAYKHQTLRVEVEVPSSVLVESWSVGGVSVSGKSDSYTIYDLSNATAVVIHCQMPNARTVSFSAKRADGAALEEGKAYITAKRVGASAEIVSGTEQPQGVVLEFSAKPEDGFRVQKWLLNGSEASGSENNTYRLTLDENADVTVVFERKPIVTIITTENGAVKAEVVAAGASAKAVESGKYVEFGDNVRFTIEPKAGYVIYQAKLNGSPVNTEVGTANTDKRFYDVNNVREDITFEVTYTAKPIITTAYTASQGTVTVKGTADFKTAVISSGGYVDLDSAADVTVSPKKGYVVGSVTVNEAPVTIAAADESEDVAFKIDNINEDKSIKVTFKKKPIIGLSYESHGSVTMNGTADFSKKTISKGDYVDFGSTLTITATPNVGYVVERVMVGETEIGYTQAGENTDAVIAEIQNINADKNITVSWKEKPKVNIDNGEKKGTVTAKGTADFSEKTISSGNYVDFNSTLTVTVQPEKGWVVETVTVDGQTKEFNLPENSDDIEVIIGNINADTDIKIKYAELDSYELSYEVINIEDGEDGAEHGVLNVKSSRKDMDSYKTEANGRKKGTITVYEGGKLILVAEGDKGWRVKEWTVDGAADDAAGGTMTLTAEEVSLMTDRTVTVQFEEGRGALTFKDPENASLSASITNREFTSGGFPEVGAVVKFVLSPEEHFVLKHWMLNGEILENEKELTYNFTADENDATVAAEVQKEQLNITAETDGNGTAEGLPAVVRHGDSVTITAIAASGYEFDGWYADGQRIEDADAEYTFIAEEDCGYLARFKLKPKAVVSFAVNNEEWGAISASANGRGFASGEKISSSYTIVFVISPVDGYRVKEWNGLPQGASIAEDKLSATISALDGDVDVTVELEKIPVYQISYTEMTNGRVVATVNGSAVTEVREGTEVTFSAIPNTGWIFKKWTNDAAGFAEAEFKLTVNNNVLVGAEFISGMYYNVKYDVTGSITGEVNGTADDAAITRGVEVQHSGGSTIKLVAAPESGKMVKAWTVNGKAAEELSNTLTFTLMENVDIKVEFEDLVLYEVPADNDDYIVTDIVKVPADYGDERQIRDRGAVEFKVTPKDGKTITAFEVPTACGDTVEATRNSDGTYNVKVTGTKQDITIICTVTEGIPLTIENAANGTVYVKNQNNEKLSSGSAVKANDILEVIATPNDGYKVSQISVNKNVCINGVYVVKQDDTAVVVSVVFAKRGGGSGGGGGGSVGSISYTVEFDANGGTAVTAVKVRSGSALEKPDDPTKDGFVFDGWYTDKECTQKYDFSTKVTKGFTLYARWNEKPDGKCDGGENCSIAEFADIILSEWYHEDIEYVYDNNLMKGITELKFGPQDKLTRAMLVTVLYRAEGEPEVNKSIPFADVRADMYYHDAVIWAEQNDIVEGVSETKFAPEANITREQIATIIYRYAKFKGVAPTGAWAIKLDYADVSEISDYAAEGVMYCTLKGIMQGRDNNMFAPKADATRAEISAILHRFIENDK